MKITSIVHVESFHHIYCVSMRLPSECSFQNEFRDRLKGLYEYGELVNIFPACPFRFGYSLCPFPLPLSVYHIVIHFTNLTIIWLSYTTHIDPCHVISCVLKRINKIA